MWIQMYPSLLTVFCDSDGPAQQDHRATLQYSLEACHWLEIDSWIIPSAAWWDQLDNCLKNKHNIW